MMDTSPEKILARYREQVLRWNRQINLVSRQDSAETLEGLVNQCRDAWVGLSEAKESISAGHLWYFDLGSGGGLPGFVWHVLAADRNIPLKTWLVEPREKRAWFLNRLNGLLGGSPITVLADRWGEIEDFGAAAEGSRPTQVLVSLKALHLTDAEVLAGLAPVLAGARDQSGTGDPVSILIARFYPPEQAWTTVLASDLEIPDPGGSFAHSGLSFEGLGGNILSPEAPGGAGLVLSEYLTTLT